MIDLITNYVIQNQVEKIKVHLYQSAISDMDHSHWTNVLPKGVTFEDVQSVHRYLETGEGELTEGACVWICEKLAERLENSLKREQIKAIFEGSIVKS